MGAEGLNLDPCVRTGDTLPTKPSSWSQVRFLFDVESINVLLVIFFFLSFEVGCCYTAWSSPSCSLGLLSTGITGVGLYT